MGIGAESVIVWPDAKMVAKCMHLAGRGCRVDRRQSSLVDVRALELICSMCRLSAMCVHRYRSEATALSSDADGGHWRCSARWPLHSPPRPRGTGPSPRPRPATWRGSAGLRRGSTRRWSTATCGCGCARRGPRRSWCWTTAGPPTCASRARVCMSMKTRRCTTSTRPSPRSLRRISSAAHRRSGSR